MQNCGTAGPESWSLAPGLLAFGQLVTDAVHRPGRGAEAHPPRLVPFSPWGERIDRIEASGAWKRLRDSAAQAAQRRCRAPLADLPEADAAHRRASLAEGEGA